MLSPGSKNGQRFYKLDLKGLYSTCRDLRTNYKCCEFAGSSLTKVIHEMFANNSSSCSPKSFFAQSGEYCSQTVREQLAKLFARTLFCPIWRTLFMNNSRNVRRHVRQITYFASPTNNFREQFANCSPNCSPKPLFCSIWLTLLMNSSRIVHRIVRQSDIFPRFGELFANNYIPTKLSYFFNRGAPTSQTTQL